MTPTHSRIIIVVAGMVAALCHAVVTLLVTLGISLGRQADDPWSPVAETLLAVAFYGTLGWLIAILLLGSLLTSTAFVIEVAVWLLLTGSFFAAITIESGDNLLTDVVVVGNPVVGLVATGFMFWALRSIRRA